jgi:flavodoxin
MFGNTEQIARAICSALASEGEANILRAGDVHPADLAGVTLLVVGSPTQKFRPLPATTRMLKSIAKNHLHGVKVAAFDTRATEAAIQSVGILAFFVKIFGYAAPVIANRLQKKGGELVDQPEGFYVSDTKGPLVDGELERAANWAREILSAAR